MALEISLGTNRIVAGAHEFVLLFRAADDGALLSPTLTITYPSATTELASDDGAWVVDDVSRDAAADSSVWTVIGPDLPAGTWRSLTLVASVPSATAASASVTFSASGSIADAVPVPHPGAASFPADPAADVPTDARFLGGPGQQLRYWMWIPSGYDPSHLAPTTLLVWLHGCGGYNLYDVADFAPDAAKRWIIVAPLGPYNAANNNPANPSALKPKWDQWVFDAYPGLTNGYPREGACWSPGADGSHLLAVIADVRSRFNIDPTRVFLGGYSSGGDLGYRTAFYNSEISGMLAINTAPFRDTGSTAAASLSAAGSRRFMIHHVASLSDDTYPIATVRDEFQFLTAHQWDYILREVPGTHYDDPGTSDNIRTLLLPVLEDEG